MNKQSITITVRTLANQAAISRKYARQYATRTEFAAQCEVEAKSYIHAAKIVFGQAKIVGLFSK